MSKCNPENERLKRRYLIYMREAKRYNQASIDGVAKSLNRFEIYTGFRSFKDFHVQQAISFKRSLRESANVRTHKPLSPSTVDSTLSALKCFFVWLAGQPGYKSKITYSDADYFNLPDKDVRIARARQDPRAPTVEQIQAVIRAMPTETVIERRNRATIAFVLLTGVRDGALISLRMKHVDFVTGRVTQFAKEVQTKNSKSFVTFFFPVPGEFLEIVGAWIRELREQHLWGDDDPLLPATDVISRRRGVICRRLSNSNRENLALGFLKRE